MLPSETMIWQPEFTDKTLSRKPGAVHPDSARRIRTGRVFFIIRIAPD
nr:PapI protein [Escherichia coli]